MIQIGLSTTTVFVILRSSIVPAWTSKPRTTQTGRNGSTCHSERSEESRGSRGPHPRHSDRSAAKWRNLPPRPAAQPPTQQQSFLVGAERRRISLTLVRNNSHLGAPRPSRKLRFAMCGCGSSAVSHDRSGPLGLREPRPQGDRCLSPGVILLQPPAASAGQAPVPIPSRLFPIERTCPRSSDDRSSLQRHGRSQ